MTALLLHLIRKAQRIVQGTSDIVGVFTDPILVFPGRWGDTLPEWLKNAITLERMLWNMKALKGEEMTGTDAEACAYLYTAGLTVPMDSDWSQIYLYVSTKPIQGIKGVRCLRISGWNPLVIIKWRN